MSYGTSIFRLFAAAAIAIAASASVSAATDRPEIYSVVHVDIDPSKLDAALPILKSFSQRAQKDSAVAQLNIYQQMGAANHFTMVEVLHSQEDYQKFVEQAYVKQMRADLQPLLGSPFDERLHTSLPN